MKMDKHTFKLTAGVVILALQMNAANAEGIVPYAQNDLLASMPTPVVVQPFQPPIVIGGPTPVPVVLPPPRAGVPPMPPPVIVKPLQPPVAGMPPMPPSVIMQQPGVPIVSPINQQIIDTSQLVKPSADKKLPPQATQVIFQEGDLLP